MGIRDRIWGYIDDSEFGRHPSLRDSLYQLLVAIECGGERSALRVEHCLDLAADAIRRGDGAAVGQARARVDELVRVLAERPALAPRRGVLASLELQSGGSDSRSAAPGLFGTGFCARRTEQAEGFQFELNRSESWQR
jgi:hypothetical protein